MGVNLLETAHINELIGKNVLVHVGAGEEERIYVGELLMLQIPEDSDAEIPVVAFLDSFPHGVNLWVQQSSISILD